MTSFFQIFTVLISNYVNSNCFIFKFGLLCFDCVVAYRTLFLYKLLKICLLFTCYNFCVQNTCAITVDIFKRLISFQNNWKMFNLLLFFISYVLRGNTVFVKTFMWSEFCKNMFAWLSYSYSGLQWVSYVAFPICLFESNWWNSYILSPRSFIIFTVLDLKSPIPSPNKSRM